MIGASRERIVALVSGLPTSKRYSRILVMLQAYFDGSTEDGKALIFAGYLASVETWMNFSDEWDELLTLRPRIGSFKMSSMAAPSLMERAMFHYRVIEKSPIFGIGCSIPIEPLNKVVKELGLHHSWANPYYLAWRTVITLSLEGASTLGLADPIEFIFDEQSDKVLIMKAWDYYFASAPLKYKRRIKGAPSFKNDEDALPLQAADFVAWWARKQYVKDMSQMKDLFPFEWTQGKEPNLLFANLPERGIRNQFNRDIEIARRIGREISPHPGDTEVMPWKE